MKNALFIVISFLTFTYSFAANQKWTADLGAGKGTVEFLALGNPSALKVRGHGVAPKGSIIVTGTTASGVITFDLSSLETGISIRDKHMKEKYLEVGKYPQAKLEVTKISIPSLDKDFSKDDVPFRGRLILHGKSGTVEGKAKIKKSGDEVTLDTHFDLKLADYGIAIPSYMEITIANKVDIDVHSEVKIKTQR